MISVIVILMLVPPILSLAILRITLGKVNAKLFFMSMTVAYFLAILVFLVNHYV